MVNNNFIFAPAPSDTTLLGNACNLQQHAEIHSICHDLHVDDRSRVLVITVEATQTITPICHIHASKQITILGGCAEVYLHNTRKKLYEGQSISIGNGITHKIINYGKIPLKYVEIRTGPYVLDDDQLV